MVLANKDMGLCFKERNEFEPCIAERFRYHALVEIAEIEHAQLASITFYVFDDLSGTSLAKRELIFVLIVFFDEVNEGFYAERIVLRGDGELLHCFIARAAIARFEQIDLLEDLAGIANEFDTFLSEGDAAIAAIEYLDPELLFGILDGSGECRL